jgi:hypothetical protein
VVWASLNAIKMLTNHQVDTSHVCLAKVPVKMSGLWK